MIVYAGALKGHHSVNLEAAMLYARRRMQGFNDPQRMCRIRKYNEDLPVQYTLYVVVFFVCIFNTMRFFDTYEMC